MSEEKFTISDDEAFEPIKKKKINSKIFIAILLIIAVAIMISVGFKLIEKRLNYVENYESGNVAGNIVLNNGIAVADKEYIYYIGSNEDVSASNVYKVKIGTDKYEKFYEGDYEIRFLNISDKFVCFTEFGYIDNDDGSYDYDVKVHKKTKDGLNDEVIVDNEISYNNINIYVVDNYLYYVSKNDENVYRVNLESNEKELFLESHTGFSAISDKYIIYFHENTNEIYARKIGEDNEIKLCDNEVFFTPQVYENNVYYLDENQKLNCVSLENSEKKILNEDIEMYNIILENGNIFYLGYKENDGENVAISLFKYNLENGKIEEVKEMSQISYINIIGNYVYDLKISGKNATAVLTNYINKSQIELQTWNFDVESAYKSADIENVIGNDT